VVKLRPVDPTTIDAELKRSQAFKVEVDAMPDGSFMCSASYKGDATGQEVLDVTEGRAPLRSLFSREQRTFYDAHAPAGIDMNKLRVQGPILLLRAKHRPREFERGITAELWLWRDGKHILEISTKCLPSEAFQAALEFRQYLEEHGVDLATRQETKTKTAMRKFEADRKSHRRVRRTGKTIRRPA
jgi:SpoVK/Ycf46/Vps4 family AAA+-type ATPase